MATVWLNGTEVLTHKGGYLPFVVELDDWVEPGSIDNVVAVHVNNADDETVPPGHSTWFNWGGLYRDVWFTATHPIHISNPITAGIPAGGGVYVWTSQLDGGFATMRIDTHIINESEQNTALRLESTLLDADGTAIATDTDTFELAAGQAQTSEQALWVESPHVWHPDDPTFTPCALGSTTETVWSTRLRPMWAFVPSPSPRIRVLHSTENRFGFVARTACRTIPMWATPRPTDCKPMMPSY